MMYVIFKTDGSLDKVNLDEFIQQGSTGVNVIFTTIQGWENISASMSVLLPNSQTTTLLSVPATHTIDGVSYTGFDFTLTNAATSIAGTIKPTLQIVQSTKVLVSYPISLIVNETGVYDNSETTITNAQLRQMLAVLSAKQDTYGVNNVRGYKSLSDLQADTNLVDNQIELYKNTNGNLEAKIKNGSSFDELKIENAILSEKATADGSGNNIVNTYANKLTTQTISGTWTYSTLPLTQAVRVYDNDRQFTDKEYVDTRDTQVQNNLTAHINNVNNPHSVTKQQVDLGNVTNDAQVKITDKGIAGGVATLDDNAKVPLSQLPDSMLGQLKYGGSIYSNSSNFNDTDTRFSLSGPAVVLLELSGANPYTWAEVKSAINTHRVQAVGMYFIVGLANGQSVVNKTISLSGLNGGSIPNCSTGDWIIINNVLDTNYILADKIDNTDAVSSVNGKTGAVVLNKSDLGLGNVDNTSDLSKPISTATQTALDSKLGTTEAQTTYQPRIEYKDISVATTEWTDGTCVKATGITGLGDNDILEFMGSTLTDDGYIGAFRIKMTAFDNTTGNLTMSAMNTPTENILIRITITKNTKLLGE